MACNTSLKPPTYFRCYCSGAAAASALPTMWPSPHSCSSRRCFRTGVIWNYNQARQRTHNNHKFNTEHSKSNISTWGRGNIHSCEHYTDFLTGCEAQLKINYIFDPNMCWPQQLVSNGIVAVMESGSWVENDSGQLNFVGIWIPTIL